MKPMGDYKINEMIALIQAGVLPISFLFVCVFIFKTPLLVGAIFSFMAVGGSMFFGMGVLKNPYTEMMKGKTTIAAGIDSTGIVQPYYAQIQAPYLNIETKKGSVKWIFDRVGSFIIKPPIKAIAVDDGYEVVWKVKKTELQSGLNQQYGKPFFMFNPMTGVILTKNMMGSMETSLMVENISLQVLNKINNLENDLDKLDRRLLDFIAPSKIMEILQNPFVMGLLVIAAIICVVIFVGPGISQALGLGAKASQGASQTIPAITSTAKTMGQSVGVIPWVF